MDSNEFSSIIKSVLAPYPLKDYQNIREWSSLQSLIVISAIDEHYGILIDYDDYRKIKSFEELINQVSMKIQK